MKRIHHENLTSPQLLGLIIASLLFLILFTQHANALEDHQRFETHSVHFTILNSTFVPVDVAKAHNIKRSRYENLLNISVAENDKYGALPVKSIKGTSTNLLQQQKKLKFIEIAEKDATYYLAPIVVNREEILHFEVRVILDGVEEPMVVNFTRTVYAD